MIRSRRLEFLVLLPVVLLCAAPRMPGQSAITIDGISNLSFGDMARSGSANVTYGSGGAAQFIVTGDTARQVRLTISFSALTAQNGSSANSDDRTFTPSITNADCAFSLDGGNSWQPFSTGTLFHDTVFPEGGSATSSIYVRVGASAALGARQQRGGYAGLITLTAEYL